VALRPCLSTGLPFSVGEHALDKSDFAYRFGIKYRRFEINDCDLVNKITVPDIMAYESVTTVTKKPVCLSGRPPWPHSRRFLAAKYLRLHYVEQGLCQFLGKAMKTVG